MTFEEKVLKLLDNRSNALVSKKGTFQSETEAEAERDFNNEYLFGDGTDEGVVNILEAYYKEMNIGVGRTSSAPALQGGVGASKTSYLSQFTNAVDLNGDSASGFYPPDAYGIGAQNINMSSIWFTTSGDNGQTTGGIV